ncbi:hypothetical protein [Reyranella sp.]|mgnify:CR=1 FL=1|uniref:hypothetical protein n=1 Tax=Reyranella sp. TaxID=1929291 RepID=UPI003BACB379
MRIFGTGFRVAAVVLALSAGLTVTAAADDFMAQCKTGTPVPDADKICKCMSEKITGADRADVIGAMTTTNAVMAKGGTPSSPEMTPKVMKGLETAMTVQAQCM